MRVYVDQRHSLADSYTLTSADVSPGGVFLRSHLLHPVGEPLDLEYVVPGVAAPVRARGRVVRVETRDHCPGGPGMAVELEHE